MGGGNVLHRRILGVMYYIGEINTGVPPGLGGTFNWGGGRGGGCINHCIPLEIEKWVLEILLGNFIFWQDIIYNEDWI